jgi:glutaredoxin
MIKLQKILAISAIFLSSGLFGFLFSGAVVLPFEDIKSVSAVSLYTVPKEISQVYFFGREDCAFCKAEKKFFSLHPEISVKYFDIVKDPKAKELFVKIATVNNLPQVTPLTLVGGKVIQGYRGDDTTGKEIIAGTKEKDVPLASYEVQKAVPVAMRTQKNAE